MGKATAVVEMVKLSLLVLDGTFYPRGKTNSVHISHLRGAIRGGATLPPLIVDRKSGIVVDGWHRYHAFLAENGPDSEVPVEYRDYADRRAMFIDMVETNGKHGLPFDSCDVARITELGRRCSVTIADISAALQRDIADIRALRKRKMATGPKGEPVVLKTSFQHMAGRTLTAEQTTANDHDQGTQVAIRAHMLTTALREGLVDWTNTKDSAALAELRDELNKAFTEN